MARRSKIEKAGLEAVVRAYARDGLASRDIEAALKRDHKASISHPAISRFLAKDIDDRRQAAQHVAASEAQKSVPLAIETLRKVAERAFEVAEAATEPADKARLYKVAVEAAEKLYRVTSGDEGSGDDKTMGKLGDRLARILGDREKRG